MDAHAIFADLKRSTERLRHVSHHMTPGRHTWLLCSRSTAAEKRREEKRRDETMIAANLPRSNPHATPRPRQPKPPKPPKAHLTHAVCGAYTARTCRGCSGTSGRRAHGSLPLYIDRFPPTVRRCECVCASAAARVIGSAGYSVAVTASCGLWRTLGSRIQSSQ